MNQIKIVENKLFFSNFRQPLPALEFLQIYFFFARYELAYPISNFINIRCALNRSRRRLIFILYVYLRQPNAYVSNGKTTQFSFLCIRILHIGNQTIDTTHNRHTRIQHGPIKIIFYAYQNKNTQKRFIPKRTLGYHSPVATLSHAHISSHHQLHPHHSE